MKPIFKLNKFLPLQSARNATQIQRLSLTHSQLTSGLCDRQRDAPSAGRHCCCSRSLSAYWWRRPPFCCRLTYTYIHTHIPTQAHIETEHCVFLLWHLRKFGSALMWHFKASLSTSLPKFIHTISSMAKEPSDDYVLIRHLLDTQPALKPSPREMNGAPTCFHHPH